MPQELGAPIAGGVTQGPVNAQDAVFRASPMRTSFTTGVGNSESAVDLRGGVGLDGVGTGVIRCGADVNGGFVSELSVAAGG